MQPIEASCTYTKKNLLEVQKVLHRKTAKICAWLALLGGAILTAGIFLVDETQSFVLIYIGGFWTIFFVIRRYHAARKSTRQTLKENKKSYGCPVTTHQKFYKTLVAATNEQSGRELRARYDEVERLILTKHMIGLILPDKIAVLTDRRTMDAETDAELIALLESGCTKALIEE